MWQVIHYTQSSEHVRQHAGARQHRTHPGVMLALECGGFPPVPHLLPHPIFSSFPPSSPLHPREGRNWSLGGEASFQTGPSRLLVLGLMPGGSPPTPPRCHHPPRISRVLLTPSWLSPVGSDTSSSYGEMRVRV